MITLIWSENTVGLNDKEVTKFVEQLFIDNKTCDQNICFSQGIITFAVRAYMVKNKIPHTEVVFKVGDKTIQVTERCRLSYNPKEFDIFDNCLDDILEIA